MSTISTDSGLATAAARLLSVVMQAGQAGSDPKALEEATRLHDARKLFPRLVVSMPHGGGAVRLELTLNDPETNEVMVRIFEGEAIAEDPTWAH